MAALQEGSMSLRLVDDSAGAALPLYELKMNQAVGTARAELSAASLRDCTVEFAAQVPPLATGTLFLTASRRPTGFSPTGLSPPCAGCGAPL